MRVIGGNALILKPWEPFCLGSWSYWGPTLRGRAGSSRQAPPPQLAAPDA
ncbi:hypothetical protein HEP81_00512 [Streptomyces griseofuscus]|uniref:Uncharacterized protein n=1 Tax=Streptomyces griseofuscus TaxID=146922 RepID=A0A7H1PS18_9ACTN|nr:hypothetical protein HEP81_00512 [Streptomyces griseofuscus]